MQFLGKMVRFEKIGNAIEGVVVDEDCAEQRLFRLDIVRRRAQGPFGLCDGETTVGQLFNGGQGWLFSV